MEKQSLKQKSPPRQDNNVKQSFKQKSPPRQDNVARQSFKQKSPLAYGAIVLTIFTLLCRFMGMGFRMYMTARIGSEGIGLYQLIMSVYTLFATLSTAGFTVAVSRLAAEQIAKAEGDEAAAQAAARRVFFIASAIALSVSLALMVAMALSSGPIAELLLKDARITLPLKVLALTMPFIALSSCLKGYFLAIRRMWTNASAMLFEQVIKIAVIMLFIGVKFKNSTDIGSLCMGVVGGATLGEVASYLYLFIIYYFAKRKRDPALQKPHIDKPIKTVLGVTLPIAASSYVTNFLHTGENIIIPMGFVSHGSDYSKALSDFGIIRGMAIPALFFPFAFLSSLVSVLIPEISRINAIDKVATKNRILRVLRLAFVFSIASGAVFFFFPNEISYLFYRTDEASHAIRLLAAVTPLMYIETICDGLLKSIGHQTATLRYNIYNSVLRILSVMLVIPRFGVEGYLYVLIVSNTFSFLLMFFKLKKESGISADKKALRFLPAAALVFAALSIIL